jgi:integration host factor subunit alpha
MKNITRDDIAEYIYQEFGLAKKDCIDLVEDIINKIIEGLVKDGNVKIHNFGTFKIKHKNQRMGRNPKTGKDALIHPRNVISFTPSKIFHKNINIDD